MSDLEAANVWLVKAYLGALESGVAGADLERFFVPTARQVEWPNHLNPKGGESDLPTLLARSEQGKKVLREQRYEVISTIAQGGKVAVEALWSGVLAIPLGTLVPGTTMKAHFAIFFELEDGRIANQRNYDCFEPW